MTKTHTPEITFRVIILSILLCLLLAISNTYLALKIGFLTSASIPAAVISMGVLRFFKNSHIFENNLVQTAASAGEAVAGGIVYTIPALIIIHYWTSFSFLENFFIALIGGTLGVMFSIPLRRVMMNDKKLRFPEGVAIAEVLKISNVGKLGVKDILLGGIVGSVIEFLQTGLKLLADSAQYWVTTSRTLMGFGVGFSPVMIGAGYLIGPALSSSIFLGAIIGWLVLIPVFSHTYPVFMQSSDAAAQIASHIWGNQIRYVGIGAMLAAGIITFGKLIKPFLQSMQLSRKAVDDLQQSHRPSADQDMPMPLVLLISGVFCVGLFFLYQYLFPITALNVAPSWSTNIVLAAVFYSVIIGFIFCAITAYFSGMVGVSASPGSSIIIAGLLLASLFLFLLLRHQGFLQFSDAQIKASEAIVIMITSIITGMACISNDNMQDLKVGHLIGATPWKQQVMLLVGVLFASLIVPLVMQQLFDVYGIAGVMPRVGMDPAMSLPAPPAAAMAMLSAAVFQQNVPWSMMLIGAAIIVGVCLTNLLLRSSKKTLSPLGVAMGIYLPFSISTPIFIGGMIAWQLNKRGKTHAYRDTMLACGLIAGPALLDVLLAIPFSILGNSDALNMAPAGWAPVGIAGSVLITLGLYKWFRSL